MKKMILAMLLVSQVTLAGGVTCKECPSESDACAPMPSCHENQNNTAGLAPHCSPYFKMMACKEDCTYSADQKNTFISQACLESCMSQPCR